MSVHQKLMQARIILQGKKLSKTGKNKFAGFSYFELSDFLPTVQEIFSSLQICGVVSYGAECATLTIFDCENPGDTIEISSPMSTASLKGVHEIQNLGAVQTYLRRYLWVIAMEIVEHDALDATIGNGEARSADTPSTSGSAPRSPGRPPAAAKAAPEATAADLLEKLEKLGITPYGIKTFAAICEVEKLEQIPAEKLNKLAKAIGADHVKMFNQGKNSKGAQILPAPVKDQVSGQSSIDELAKAAEDAFGDE